VVARCGGATPPVDETWITDPVVDTKAEHTAGGFNSSAPMRESGYGQLVCAEGFKPASLEPSAKSRLAVLWQEHSTA
jgi:hypothetical protein